MLITHADGSCLSKVIIHVCVSVCHYVILYVYQHDKTGMAESTITKLGTGIVRHDRPTSPTNERSKGQSLWSQGQKNAKDDCVAGVSYALYRVRSSSLNMLLA